MAAKDSSKSRNQARLAILEMSNIVSVPMSLIAAIRLNVPDAIWQSGSNTPVSASEILSRVLPSGDAVNLERILRLLTSYGVFAEHISSSGKRKFSLTDMGKTLVPDDEGGSFAAYVLQHHQDALMRTWPLVHETVKDPTKQPFVKVNGESAWDYYVKRPEMNELMVKAMSGVAAPFMKAMLESYEGFEGVERLVDVGGSAGDCLKMILDKNPNVREGINFDLPEVVARAPVIPGVTHVGGDMFKSIPKGDAIFMKWVMVTWTDEECQKLLENCYRAVPEGGKVVACEPILPEESDESHRTRALLGADVFVMTMYRPTGKHRTKDQYRRLGLAAGFPRFRVLNFDYYAFIEYQK